MRDIQLEEDEADEDLPYCTCQSCVALRRFALAGCLEDMANSHPQYQVWWADLNWPKIVDALVDDSHTHHDIAEEMVNRVVPDPRLLLRALHRDVAISGVV